FVTADVTDLTACKKLIYFYKLLAHIVELVLQECYKHSSAVISHRLAEIKSLRHCFHIKIFNTYAIV
ncbi:MAG: hypothetical protein K2H85_07965, partial [Allobaculum sp.]|nr:hypothetical protein [Allobaculum sp.]